MSRCDECCETYNTLRDGQHICASDAAKAHEARLVQRGRDEERARAIAVVEAELKDTRWHRSMAALETVLEKLRGTT